MSDENKRSMIQITAAEPPPGLRTIDQWRAWQEREIERVLREIEAHLREQFMAALALNVAMIERDLNNPPFH